MRATGAELRRAVTAHSTYPETHNFSIWTSSLLMHPVSIVSSNSFELPDASDPLRLLFLIRVLPVPAFGTVAILLVIREADTISFQYEVVCRARCSSS